MTGPRSIAGPIHRFLALAAGLLLLTTSAPAAIEAYWKIPVIPGEVPGPGTKDWVAIQSLQFGFSNSVNSLGTLTVNANNLALAKSIDRGSPKVFLNVMKATHYPNAYLYVRNVGGATPLLAFNLKNAVAQGWQIEGTAANDRPAETTSVTFASMELSVWRPDAGTGTVTSDSVAWDFSTKTAVTTAPPTITAANLTVNEDTTGSVTVTVGDDYSSPDALALAATSSSPALITTGGLAFSGTIATQRTLTLTPVANAFGTATITLTATDTAGLSTTTTFLYTVNAVNDAPVVAPVAAETTTVGIARAVTVNLSDVDTADTTLTLAATSDNATVLPPGGIVLTGTGASRTLTLTPAAAGSAVVTLTAYDGIANSAPVSFTFIANTVGYGIPTDITLSASTVAENAANGTGLGTLGVVDADNASGHAYALVDDAGGRFRLSGPALVVNNGALLDYEAAAAHSITIQVTDPDNHTFSKRFTITVTNVNEAPVVTLAPPGAAAPGRTLTLSQISAADPDAGGADVRLEFTVLHGTLACDASGALGGKITGNRSATLVITAPLADLDTALTAGALAYTPAAGFAGDDILQVACSDLGHTGSGGALIDTRLAVIHVAVDSFAAWQALNFTTDELADPAISGPLAVLRHDGLTNLLKYALGLDPRATATLLPQLGLVGSDWAFTYTRPAARPDLAYTVQVSSDLTNWSSGTVTHTLVSSDPAAATETWRGTCPHASAAKLFARLQVTLSP